MLLRRVARPLLAATFIAGGIATLRAPAGPAAAAGPVLAPVLDVVDPLVPIERPSDKTMVTVDAVVKIAAGTMLALGKFPRVAAATLAASLVPTTLAGHRFWEEDDPAARTAQRKHFLKNVGLIGGLLITAADTEAKPSWSWRARRAVSQATAQVGAQVADQSSALATIGAAAGERLGEAQGAISGVASKLADHVPDDLPAKAVRRGGALRRAVVARAPELAEQAVRAGREVATRAEGLAEHVPDDLPAKAVRRGAALRRVVVARAPELAEQAVRAGREVAARAPELAEQVAHAGVDVAARAEELARHARERAASIAR